jgi:type I restriction enzyme, S subunit
MTQRILKHWRDVSLLEVAPIKASMIDPRKVAYRKMYLIAPDHIESGSGRIKNNATAESQKAISGKYFAKKNSVIYTKIRPYLMKAAIVYEDVLCSADMYPL